MVAHTLVLLMQVEQDLEILVVMRMDGLVMEWMLLLLLMDGGMMVVETVLQLTLVAVAVVLELLDKLVDLLVLDPVRVVKVVMDFHLLFLVLVDGTVLVVEEVDTPQELVQIRDWVVNTVVEQIEIL